MLETRKIFYLVSGYWFLVTQYTDGLTLSTDELRQRFLEFFKSKGHKIYPSDTLVPKDDPTLLFTSAGMNQFKQEFLGKPTDFKRRATCQKCLRTADLDKVGKTSSHHTFFEMLGNFSFGDYFKAEAIAWAWEFVTGELNLPADRLWVSVYQDDREAERIWQEEVGIRADRIVKLGAKDNFWPADAPTAGPNGPCGPCSEIFFDRGRMSGCGRPGCSPACDCGRFVETWNLVFTQFDRVGPQQLEPLPHQNIDTGMGLERMAAVLQGVNSNFEIDIFKPIVEEIADLAARSPDLRLCYTIADHIRAVTFAISDGVLPSNDERGYVIRKLIRRAVWQGQSLGIKKAFLYKVVPIVCKVMKSPYPELEQKREDIARVLLAEERRFQKTLERAIVFAQSTIAELKQQGKTALSGEVAFKLYDTYGLPQEMLESIVASGGLKFDQEGFDRELAIQRQSSRKGAGFEEGVFVGTLVSKFKLKPSNFVGEKQFGVQTRVLALFQDEQPIKQAGAGRTIKIVLEPTPFYGESGGQVGDTGVMNGRGLKVEILDTQKTDQTIIHLGKVVRGKISLNDLVEAQIDAQRRRDIAHNHTATHLLQAALREVLGEHVRQSGSRVGPDKLRFDFTHFQALDERELKRIEALVNQRIRQDSRLAVSEVSLEQAQKMGALAFFGDKYQEKVRIVKIGDVSLELCGGTHVASSGELGMFKIISESSVASGIRRIEAVTGTRAQELLEKEQDELKTLAGEFGVKKAALPGRVQELLTRMKELHKRLEQARMGNFRSRIDELMATAPEISGIKIVARKIESADMPLLRLMADALRQKTDNAVIVLASVWQEQAFLVCTLTAELRAQGLDAVKIIRALAGEVAGSGGGRADFAQAGGRHPQGLDKALGKVEEAVRNQIIRKGPAS